MKIGIVFGTRPEVIKLAPLIKELDNFFEVVVINTGQHRELLLDVLNFFQIKPNYNLGCMESDLTENSSLMIKRLGSLLKEEKIDCLFVQGDTLTCFITSYVAFVKKIPLMHVEAGLRSKDKHSPFPEEMFRKLTDALADVYFTPTKKATETLLLQGFHEDRIVCTGNTVVDAVYMAMKLWNENKIVQELSQILKIDESILKESQLVFITSHRRENIGKPLENICNAILKLSKKYDKILFIWSLHKNPEVRKIVLDSFNKRPPNLLLTEALSYEQTLFMIKNSVCVITDSGGLQEEACTLKKPVIITRNTTERPEVVEVGLGFLAGTEKDCIVNVFDEIYRSYKDFLKDIENPYGDGSTSKRIRDFLLCDKVKAFIKDYTKNYKEELRECQKKFSLPY